MEPSFRDGPISLNGPGANSQMGGDLIFSHPAEVAELYHFGLARS